MGKYKDMDPGFHYKPIGGYGKIKAVPMPTVTGNKNDKSKAVPMPTIGNKKKKKKSNEAIIQEFKVRHKSLLQGYKK
jgi:hypothetical protein